ncbi:MAG: ATP-binding protein, partial [Desulfobacteraceae bacterium]|nr:ATP-binding protein [Desulfobacteraceae bacterium]
MFSHNAQKKVVIIAVMIGGILCLHYFTFPDMRYHHAVYRMLFYLPLILGTLWFGMKGAVYICVSVSVLFLPQAIRQWQGFSLDDFHRLSEGVLYIIIALILGFLVERERKKQRALVRVKSLAAVGKAVSEIAHDMKTPLMAIGGFAKQVSKKLGPDNPDRKKLDFVIQETAHLESMVREMLDFGKPVELHFTEIDFNELVSDSVRVAQPMAKENGVELETGLAPSLPSVVLDVPRVKQILLNLITNAIQASTAGDRVRVCTSLNSLGVVLEVADHGGGIAKKYRKSIFHPFFSTKREGTGLGLGIVKKIVETHGGDVSFSANQEK